LADAELYDQESSSTGPLKAVERDASVRDAPARVIDDDRLDGGLGRTTLQ
jgi:hypothetical protein